jgi:two-component system LytT family response regulator
LVASCASAIAASKVLQQNQVDLLFLDIEMPVLKGADFFKNLK